MARSGTMSVRPLHYLPISTSCMHGLDGLDAHIFGRSCLALGTPPLYGWCLSTCCIPRAPRQLRHQGLRHRGILAIGELDFVALHAVDHHASAEAVSSTPGSASSFQAGRR